MFSVTHAVVCNDSDKHDAGICLKHMIGCSQYLHISSDMYLYYSHINDLKFCVS